MPDDLVANKLADGRLVCPTYFRGVVRLVAARQVGLAHGPIAAKLWDALSEQFEDRSRQSQVR
jgi:hypothetical protein